jgi:YspA, cpYpsA-related SLOG family
MSRILVTGSRDFNDYRTIMRGLTVAIEDVIASRPADKEIVIVHGNARGADTLAKEFALRAAHYMTSKGYRLRHEAHPAKWDEYGRGAGPRRNQEMVDLGADLCVKFVKRGASNRGTTDCSNRATKAGIKILEFTA